MGKVVQMRSFQTIKGGYRQQDEIKDDKTPQLA
jgi:hypothetical protein